LSQLQNELVAASVPVANGLLIDASSPEPMPPGDLHQPPGATLFALDAQAQKTDLAPAAQAIVDAHVALRDKTDAEYAAEFQDPATTAVRRQEIRDITGGLLPREQVRVDNGLPLEDPPAEEDPLVTVRSAHGVTDLRDAIVAYLERFGG